MRNTQSKVYLLARPQLNWAGLSDYLVSIGAAHDEEDWSSWVHERITNMEAEDAEVLVEAAGRICYRSWEPGMNPNVTRIRENRADYFENIMRSAHGSVLEHAQFSFILQNVSRVVTHELTRHRAGTAISQESLRFVRLDDIPVRLPEWAKDDPVLMRQIKWHMDEVEDFQKWMTGYFGLDEPGMSFHEKKAKTSFMRRFAPEGLTTDLIWSANVRTLRHVIDVRTDPGAEEEIRDLFLKVFEVIREQVPLLFEDFTVEDGHASPKYRKV